MRVGTRTIALRVNRVANAAVYTCLAVAILVFLFGAYRLTESGIISGVVIMALGVVLAIWPVRKLGPGRLLNLEVTPTEVVLIASFEPSVTIVRTTELRAVIWVSRRYTGGDARLSGLYLLEGDTVLARARPATFTTDRLHRFLTNVAIPTELVDAEAAPFATSLTAQGG